MCLRAIHVLTLTEHQIYEYILVLNFVYMLMCLASLYKQRNQCNVTLGEKVDFAGKIADVHREMVMSWEMIEC
jgi:hypothetical protein